MPIPLSQAAALPVNLQALEAETDLSTWPGKRARVLLLSFP